jgi:hypothetical protein
MVIMPIKPPPETAFYFVSIQLNISALIRYRDLTERYIDELPDKVPRWVDLASPEGRMIMFHDGLVRSLLPITLRSTFRVAAWSLYESTVLEIAAFVGDTLKLEPLSINPDVGFFTETATYYAGVLGFARDESAAVTHELRLLYKLRNAIAHGGGRRGAMRKNDWRQLVRAAKDRGDFSTARGVIEPSADLVYQMTSLVQDTVSRLISEARARLVT